MENDKEASKKSNEKSWNDEQFDLFLLSYKRHWIDPRCIWKSVQAEEDTKLTKQITMTAKKSTIQTAV